MKEKVGTSYLPEIATGEGTPRLPETSGCIAVLHVPRLCSDLLTQLPKRTLSFGVGLTIAGIGDGLLISKHKETEI